MSERQDMGWTYGGCFPHFTVFPIASRVAEDDGRLNGVYETEWAALDALIDGLETSRRELSSAIAEHKARRRRIVAAAIRTANTGADHD